MLISSTTRRQSVFPFPSDPNTKHSHSRIQTTQTYYRGDNARLLLLLLLLLLLPYRRF